MDAVNYLLVCCEDSHRFMTGGIILRILSWKKRCTASSYRSMGVTLLNYYTIIWFKDSKKLKIKTLINIV